MDEQVRGISGRLAHQIEQLTELVNCLCDRVTVLGLENAKIKQDMEAIRSAPNALIATGNYESLLNEFSPADTIEIEGVDNSALNTCISIDLQAFDNVAGQPITDSEMKSFDELFECLTDPEGNAKHPYRPDDFHVPRQLLRKSCLRKSSGPLNILVVEDDPLCQQLISQILKKFQIGHVELVSDGVDAVINMSTGSFDLILMDMQLPHLDGLQATQNIRKFNRRTPIISMTANVEAEDLKRYFEGGIDDVLPKPFDANALLSIIQQFYKCSLQPTQSSIEHIEEL